MKSMSTKQMIKFLNELPTDISSIIKNDIKDINNYINYNKLSKKEKEKLIFFDKHKKYNLDDNVMKTLFNIHCIRFGIK